MHLRPAHLPNYQDPPVVEVVLGVQFEQLEGFQTVHVGRLWQGFRKDYPKFVEQPPIGPAFETFGTRVEAPTVQLKQFTHAPLPRLWFVNEEETELIQFQPDKFLHNWRKVKDRVPYPHYEHLREKFNSDLEKLEKLLKREKIGKLKPNQCEVSYINHILSPDVEDLHSSLGTLFRFWSDRNIPKKTMMLEDTRIAMRFLIHSKTTKDPVGRLHVTAEPRKVADGTPMIVLNLTARGRPDQATAQGVLDFLDRGREEIVEGFTALTTDKMQKRWGRIK